MYNPTDRFLDGGQPSTTGPLYVRGSSYVNLIGILVNYDPNKRDLRSTLLLLTGRKYSLPNLTSDNAYELGSRVSTFSGLSLIALFSRYPPCENGFWTR